MNCVRVLWVGFLSVLFGAPAFGIQLEPGDLITAQFDNFGTILKIDPQSGDRELISKWEERGEGPRLWRPSSILFENAKTLLVADGSIGEGIFRVDLDTGDRSIITHRGFPSIPLRGQGPLDHISSIHLTSSNELIAVNSGGGNFNESFVTTIDFATGDRSLISGLGIGSGPDFSQLGGGYLLSETTLIVTDAQGSILGVDLTNGQRSVVSGATRGAGPSFGALQDLTVLGNGDIYAIDYVFSNDPFVFEERLFRVSPVTGDRTIVASVPGLANLGERIVSEGDSSLLTSPLHSILRVDPLTGEITEVSGTSTGVGPVLFWGDIAVVNVPEPTTSTLALATLFIVARLRR